MKIMIKRFLVLSACIFVMAAFAGCAVSNMGPANTAEGVYHPKLPAGIKTFEGARTDLAGLLENRQSPLDLYFGANYFARHNIRDLIADITAIEEGTIAEVKQYNYFRTCLVTDIEEIGDKKLRASAETPFSCRYQ